MSDNNIYIDRTFESCNCYNKYLKERDHLELFVTIDMDCYNYYPKFEYCPFCGAEIREEELIELGEPQPINRELLNKIKSIAKLKIKDMSDEIE